MFHYHIDIPVPIVKALPATPQISSHSYHYERHVLDLCTDEFISWIENKGFAPRKWSNLIMFYAHPNSRTSIHTDIGSPNIWALNCLLTPGHVEIQWCDAVGGTTQTEDLKYVTHDPSSPVIERTRMRNTLCRINVPHASVNHGDGAWFLSFRCIPANLPFTQLCKRFTNPLI
jgi:hypothetical protein